MKSKLTVKRREDGDWMVTAVQTRLDCPKVGTVLTTPDLHVMNQANAWEITRDEL